MLSRPVGRSVNKVHYGARTPSALDGARAVSVAGGLPADFDSLTFSYLLGSGVLTVHIAFLSSKTIVVEVSKKDIIYNVKT